MESKSNVWLWVVGVVVVVGIAWFAFGGNNDSASTASLIDSASSTIVTTSSSSATSTVPVSTSTSL